MSTSQAKKTPLWARAIAYVAIALAAIVLAGLLLVSYDSMLALILGLMVGALGLWLIGSRRLQALARRHSLGQRNSIYRRRVRRRWMQRAILVLVLVPLLAAPILIVLGDRATLGLILLLGIVAVEPTRALLSFLRARAREGRWRGWKWVQRFLVAALLAVILLPTFIALALALAIWRDMDEAILLLACVALALAGIGLLSWQIEVIFLPTVTQPPAKGWRGWAYAHCGLIAFLLAALFFTLSLLVSQVGIGGFHPEPPTVGLVKTYIIDIEPVDLAQGTFTVQERGTSNLSGNSPKTKTYHHEGQVQSTRRGMLLREVHIAPLRMDAAGRVRLQFADETSLQTAFCGTLCPESSVTLLDMPANAFYDARDATITRRDPYIDSETISLSIRDLRQGIVFAYVRPPFHHFAFLLRPFLGASTVGRSALALSGFVGVVIAVPILRPNRFRAVKQALRTWFGKEDDLEWLAQASQAEEFAGDVHLGRDQRMALYRLLATRLDESELHALYFGLDVPYDSLTDGGTIDHARELVLYCARTQRLDELLAHLARERPDLDLDEWEKG